MVKRTQYEMLNHIAVTFNALSSDSYVLFVCWCFVVAGILSAVCLKTTKVRQVPTWKLRNNKAYLISLCK